MLLRDKEKRLVPSAGARQWSVRRARTGFLVAACFLALTIFPSEQKLHKYLSFYCCFYYCHDRGSIFCLK